MAAAPGGRKRRAPLQSGAVGGSSSGAVPDVGGEEQPDALGLGGWWVGRLSKAVWLQALAALGQKGRGGAAGGIAWPMFRVQVLGGLRTWWVEET